jgi:hypothetical protein
MLQYSCLPYQLLLSVFAITGKSESRANRRQGNMAGVEARL